ncbi:MAG: signal peptide peptidase SppA [Bacteroidales bacterium]|nr:signal peptide peptidase SppA [Bacteroidales bacterium]
MKQFIKTVVAVICGLIIFNLILLMFGMAFLGAMAAAGKSTSGLSKEGVLYMDMSQFAIADQESMPDPLSIIQGGSTTTIGIWKAVQAINAAAKDPGIKFIYMVPDGVSAGNSDIFELRTALENFRKSGKAIVSKMDAPTNGSLFLASVSDKVYLSSYEGATTGFNGISSQIIYYKDLLDKLGVNVQLIRHGKYKSAGEVYIKSEPSPENLEQNQVMINTMWNSFAGVIAESRGISVDRLNQMIDNLELNFPEDFLKAGLVDELMTREQCREKLTDLAMAKKFDDIKFIPFEQYVESKVKDNLKAKKKVAIIYANGQIVDGTQNREVAGARFAQIISEVRADSTVKAVVFRVNSPGGSVFASEQIKAEIDLTAKVKPVIASYGDYAASGGYWISNNCDKIYSNATTLTGSIGVFSMIPDLSGTVKDIAHLNIVKLGSNKHSGMLSLTSPLDQEETEYMQASVERIYDRFVNIVSQGRGLEPAFVDSIAQGRVWTGADALQIGLVDEIGTLEDALNYAINVVEPGTDLSKWNVAEYPKPQTPMEMMMEMMGNSARAKANIFKGTPLEDAGYSILDLSKSWKDRKSQYMMARIPYEIIFNN